jgi:hypothetical protein
MGKISQLTLKKPIKAIKGAVILCSNGKKNLWVSKLRKGAKMSQEMHLTADSE